MADKRIKDLTETSQATNTDYLAVDDSVNGTRKFSFANLISQLRSIFDISGITSKANGAMQKTVYDPDNDGVVVDSDKLGGVDASEYALNDDLADVATSGSYNDLSNKPTIPTALSELAEDSSHKLMTSAEKTKLAGIETGAQANVQSNWNQSDNTKDDFIKNKPNLTDMATQTWVEDNHGGTYSKPSDGIPKTDLASAVQSSLDKADSALQEHQSLSSYRTSSEQDAIDATKIGDAPSDNKQYARKNGAWSEVVGGGGGGTGDHTQLTNRDSNDQHPMSAITGLQSALGGKANTEDVPTKTSDLVNDSNFATENYVDSHAYDDTALKGRVTTVEGKIPEQATSSNQLADKDFVNSSIATNTATFRGTFNSVAELQAYSGTKTINDYAFVIIYDPVVTTEVLEYDRYKYNGASWVYEYALNNSSFTAQQWASINSGIVQDDVTKLGGIEAGADVTDSANVKSAGATMGVKVAGTELTKDSDGKVDVPVATTSSPGVIRAWDNYGISMMSDGRAYIQRATDAQIAAKEHTYRPIVPLTLDYAVKVALVSNAQITTDTDKSDICDTVGAVSFVSQSLSSAQRIQAKGNVGISYGDSLPASANEGDIFFLIS